MKRGLDVRVYSLEAENPLASDFERGGVQVVSYDEKHSIYEDRLNLLLHDLRNFRPQVVLANLSPASYEVLRYVPEGVFRTLIVHSDDPGIYGTVSSYLGNLDLIGTVSETIRQRLVEMHGSEVAVQYLPLGVPMPSAPPVRDFSGPIRVLYLGRIDKEQKRVQLFPEIYTALERSGIEFHWTIAGDGPAHQWLKNKLETAVKAGRLTFTGRVAYAEVPKLLVKHDIFLLASDYEGLPLGMLEAMGSGMVPVVSDLESGIRQVVCGSTGIRVPLADTSGYSRAVIHLSKNRDLMRRLSEAARDRVLREFSPEAMTDRWLRAFPGCFGKVSWPLSWKIRPPLAAPNSWRFTMLGKFARTLSLKAKVRLLR
jgi:glycosyltransferase involved in cell wall biosynthesis